MKAFLSGVLLTAVGAVQAWPVLGTVDMSTETIHTSRSGSVPL